MKSEALERLLTDRALGELSPDVEELLETHLEREPAARIEAEKISETLRLARRALAGQPAVALPVLRPSWRLPFRALAMAACFVGGLSLGIFAMRGRNEPPRVTASIPSHEMSAITTADESDFWSARRFRAGLSPVAINAGNRFIWKSPVRKPEIL
jgi:anti-sigma factor RsiW